MVAKKKKSNKWQVIAAVAVIAVAVYVFYPVIQAKVYASQPAAKSDINGDTEAGNFFTSDVSSLELPAFDSEEFIIYNADGRYTILYDTLYRQAAWVAYVLTKNDIASENAKRRNRFIPDPQVVAMGYPTAKTSDYTSSGYDRGHLCPSADRTANQTENDCTFMLSNISPQKPALNRGVWKNLEEQSRRWATEYDSLYIVTGGILKPGLRRISGGVGVPEYFYKALLTYSGGEYRAIAFIIPNSDHSDRGWEGYAVSVDSLETVLSADLFHNLPDDLEQKAESDTSFEFWLSGSRSHNIRE